MDLVPLTARGVEKLREELKYLKSVKRPEIVEAIATAREHGDLKENAEYHAAREQQSFNEGRIQQLEGELSNCQIIDVTTLPNNGKVVFGTTVVLYDEAADAEVTYRIVGAIEADIKLNQISITSPIARALIGKQEGDEAVVDAPSGKKYYEVIEVRYE
ncbi:MAG: transcription elongation factor GreA [Gammaproteobacteria bacterium]|nr:transcription elongation factor GreA [Gammaproteobacteria bacterium]NNM14416.1 transcription elongation factor GreA [Gammaproteobacteria bacterium]